ncbi:predicted protein [Nematostella vectensis]|uniref:Protein SREK1IP1 n=1 Tax=Nematostella vectensis TaxID=45351 RepID=A7TCJ9_NEMVE|nr:predicted protein [Nematostella vectensis]|eukprot:XP_001618323.1 hypothetical protein NEMVEDRAFT_v1g225273 [Nematostella vectensis]
MANTDVKGLIGRLTNQKTDDKRVGCKKCGYPGHLTFQCRNFIPVDPKKDVVVDVSSTSSEDTDDDAEVSVSSTSTPSSESVDLDADSGDSHKRRKHKEKKKHHSRFAHGDNVLFTNKKQARDRSHDRHKKKTRKHKKHKSRSKQRSEDSD